MRILWYMLTNVHDSVANVPSRNGRAGVVPRDRFASHTWAYVQKEVDSTVMCSGCCKAGVEAGERPSVGRWSLRNLPEISSPHQ